MFLRFGLYISEMKRIKDYHDLHLKCDALWLTDAFEKFKNSSLKCYGWFQSCYLNALALSWDAMLSIIKVELEIFSDGHMCLFFEEGIKGRICYISKTQSKANNKYLKSNYPKQESNHITFI